MNKELRQLIRQKMREKDTEELLAIWKGNDREEWTEEAFEAVREILVERVGNLPEQDEEADSPDGVERDDQADTYYNFDRLTAIAGWARSLSWVFLILAAVAVISGVLIVFQSLNGPSFEELFFALLRGLQSVLVYGFLFVVAQAVAEGIYVLMDIEDNTRRAASARENRSEGE